MGNIKGNNFDILLTEINNEIDRFIGSKHNLIKERNLGLEYVYLDREFKVMPYLKHNYNKLYDITSNEIYKLLKQNSDNLISIDKLINDIVFNYLFENKMNISLRINLQIENFINTIKNISMLTYENKSIDIGIILCRNKNALKKIKSMNEFTLINLNKVRIDKLFLEEKPLLKLIDNKNYVLLLDDEFYVIGILRRNNDCKLIDKLFKEKIMNYQEILFKCSILDELMDVIKEFFSDDFLEMYIDSNKEAKNVSYELLDKIESKKINIDKNMEKLSKKLIKLLYHEKNQLFTDENSTLFNDIMYITLNNKESVFYSSNEGVICYKNGRWNLRNYISLYHEIFLAIHKYPQKLVLERIFTIIDDIIILGKYQNDRLLTFKTNLMGKLDNLTKLTFKFTNNILNISNRKIGALFVIINDENIKEFEDNKQEYMEMHDTEKNYMKLLEISEGINISEIDDELFILLSSIDGAVILDNSLNIISYGSMIKTQDIDRSNCANVYGARTNAAINATKLGTSIKISEDGDIDIYRNVIFRDGTCILENVLTIK